MVIYCENYFIYYYEIGFDNQGKDYDGKGYLIDWWQEETVKKFNEKAACVINQYSNFEVLPGFISYLEKFN